jgi:hypothetical protein
VCWSVVVSRLILRFVSGRVFALVPLRAVVVVVLVGFTSAVTVVIVRSLTMVRSIPMAIRWLGLRCTSVSYSVVGLGHQR